MTTSLDASN